MVFLNCLIGNKFDENCIKNLCETHSLVACNNIRRFKYTKIGKKICKQVCRQQKELLHPKHMTKKKLTRSYCTKIESNSIYSTCVCVFELTFKETFNFIFFHFTPNSVGQLAMIYFYNI